MNLFSENLLRDECADQDDYSDCCLFNCKNGACKTLVQLQRSVSTTFRRHFSQFQVYCGSVHSDANKINKLCDWYNIYLYFRNNYRPLAPSCDTEYQIFLILWFSVSINTITNLAVGLNAIMALINAATSVIDNYDIIIFLITND